MDKKELKQKTIEELIKLKDTVVGEVNDAYFEMRTGKLKNVRKPRLLRKKLAMVQTVLQEKQDQKIADADNMSERSHE